MLLLSLLLTPILGVFAIFMYKDRGVSLEYIKSIALITSILNYFISLVIFILFDFSTNQFQFVQEYHEISYFDFYLGVDGLSIYFILLTTLIIPISLVSNWKSITKDVKSYVIIILLLESLLLAAILLKFSLYGILIFILLMLPKGYMEYTYIIFLIAVPLFSDYLRILKDRCAPGLEWASSNPPKPHVFNNLPLESNILLAIIHAVVIRLDIIKIINLYTLFLKITDLLVSIVITIAKIRYL